MDDFKIQNALSRSLGFEVNEESVGFMSVTSRGNTGAYTLREDVHHLFVDTEALPQYWFETLRYELRRLEFQEFNLLKFGADDGGNDNYEQYCRNLNPALLKIGTGIVKFNCVEIDVDDTYYIRIVLRDKATHAA